MPHDHQRQARQNKVRPRRKLFRSRAAALQQTWPRHTTAQSPSSPPTATCSRCGDLTHCIFMIPFPTLVQVDYAMEAVNRGTTAVCQPSSHIPNHDSDPHLHVLSHLSFSCLVLIRTTQLEFLEFLLRLACEATRLLSLVWKSDQSPNSRTSVQAARSRCSTTTSLLHLPVRFAHGLLSYFGEYRFAQVSPPMLVF